MARISIDDQASEIQAVSMKRIGEVLMTVMSSLPPDRIVTEIVVDGRKLCGFEESKVLDSNLEMIEDLTIRTGSKAMWAANGVDIALSSVQAIQKSLIRATQLFREGDIIESSYFFDRCLDGLEKFAEVLTIARCVSKIEFNKVVVNGLPFTQVEHEFTQILRDIRQYRENQDFEALADKTEYELLTNLYWWNQALNQVRTSNQLEP